MYKNKINVNQYKGKMRYNVVKNLTPKDLLIKYKKKIGI